MLPDNFRPMLAINYEDVKQQPKNRIMSEKLDGIRILFFGGIAYSRSLKPLPNKILQSIAMTYKELEGCDGEVIAGDKYANDVLQRSNSFCMKADKEDDFCIYLFDHFSAKVQDEPYLDRLVHLNIIKCSIEDSRIQLLEQIPVKSEEHLSEYERVILELGGEGLIVRDADSKYKFGRSGKKNPELQKVKRFDDDDFEVIGYEQFETNTNEKEVNELGLSKRSAKKEGKVKQEMLGSLILKTEKGVVFNCGSGYTQELRNELWVNRDSLIGKKAKVQFFGYSKDDVPLLPVFLDFRSELDL